MFGQTIARFLCIFIGIWLLASCSNKEIYSNIQLNQRQKCQDLKLPPAAYDECVSAYNESYDDYEKKRQQALKKK